MNESKEREAFERWTIEVTRRAGFGAALSDAAMVPRADNGEYRSWTTENAWEAWLARAALAQPEPERLTGEQIGKHKLRAGDCPPDSEVLLVSSIQRLQAKNVAAALPEPEPELPALPEGEVMGTYGLTRLIRYTKGHMQSYALAAILADRKRREG